MISSLISCVDGFDCDHIAAISDITEASKRASTATRIGLLYPVGQATMIALLDGTSSCSASLFHPS
jgi:high-affinity nickel permease